MTSAPRVAHRPGQLRGPGDDRPPPRSRPRPARPRRPRPVAIAVHKQDSQSSGSPTPSGHTRPARPARHGSCRDTAVAPQPRLGQHRSGGKPMPQRLGRRALLAAAGAGGCGRRRAQAQGAQTQDAQPEGAQTAGWPARPVRIVVPFTPGGSNDAIARPLAERLQARFGQPFVVENRPGAGSAVGVGGGGAERAGRPHAAADHVLDHRHRPGPGHRLQPGRRAGCGGAAGQGAADRPDVAGLADRQHRGAGRRRPGAAGPPALRQFRPRQHHPYRGGAVQPAGRDHAAARALSRHGGGADRSRRRAGGCDVHHHRQRRRADPRRAAAGHRLYRGGAAGRHAAGADGAGGRHPVRIGDLVGAVRAARPAAGAAPGAERGGQCGAGGAGLRPLPGQRGGAAGAAARPLPRLPSSRPRCATMREVVAAAHIRAD